MGKVKRLELWWHCTARHFRFGTWKISGQWIFVDTSVPGVNSLCDKAATEVCFTGSFLLKSDSPQSSYTSVSMDSIHSWITSELGIPSKGKSFVPNHSVQFWGPKPPHQWQVRTLVPWGRRATWWPLWSLTTAKVTNTRSCASLPHTPSLWRDQQRVAILTLPNK